MENNILKNNKVENENIKNETNNFIDMDTLINNLKSEDYRNISMSKTLKWAYIALIFA